MGCDRALIAGCSIGGMIAQPMATLAPGPGGGPVPVEHRDEGRHRRQLDRADRARSARAACAAIAPEMMERWFAPDFLATPEALPWGVDAAARPIPRAISPPAACWRRPTCGTDPDAITARALFLAGSADQSTPPDLVRATARPDSRRAGGGDRGLGPYPRHRQPRPRRRASGRPSIESLT